MTEHRYTVERGGGWEIEIAESDTGVVATIETVSGGNALGHQHRQAHWSIAAAQRYAAARADELRDRR